MILGADPDCKDCRGKGSTYGQRCDCTTRAPRDAEIASLRAALAAGPAALREFGDAEMTARTAAAHVEAAQKKAMGDS